MDTSQLKLFEQQSRNIQTKTFIGDINSIDVVEFSTEKHCGNIRLKTGEIIESVCLRCHIPTCMHFSKEELNFNAFESFASDTDSAVCPSMAISWSHDRTAPIIDPNLCISCGLCIYRCPIGAIYYDDTMIACVNDNESKFFELAHSQDVHKSMIEKLNSISKYSILPVINEEHFTRVYGRINEVGVQLPLKFPNLIIRNLLILLGLDAVIGRKGDVYTRMDLLFSDMKSIGIAEIERGLDILNSPRNILDNVAVMHSRYNFDKKLIVPLIISFSLPNQRSEYWQVISDINKITGIKINSLTLGALLLLLWQNKQLNIDDIQTFYADSDTYSIRESIIKLTDRTWELSEGCLGILETTK